MSPTPHVVIILRFVSYQKDTEIGKERGPDRPETSEEGRSREEGARQKSRARCRGHNRSPGRIWNIHVQKTEGAPYIGHRRKSRRRRGDSAEGGKEHVIVAAADLGVDAAAAAAAVRNRGGVSRAATWRASCSPAATKH